MRVAEVFLPIAWPSPAPTAAPTPVPITAPFWVFVSIAHPAVVTDTIPNQSTTLFIFRPPIVICFADNILSFAKRLNFVLLLYIILQTGTQPGLFGPAFRIHARKKNVRWIKKRGCHPESIRLELTWGFP
jgi:hypothetical protein